VRHWTFWEWVAYAAIFVAALIIAADTGFKTAPDLMTRLPEFFSSVWWGFAPVTLVIVATIILLLREFVFTGAVRNPPSSASARDAAQKDGRSWLSPSPSPAPPFSVQLRFINKSSGAILIKLEPPAPEPGFFARTALGGHYPVMTYPGHRWSVTDLSGQELISYVVTTEAHQDVSVG
jgi:hypothetical protein